MVLLVYSHLQIVLFFRLLPLLLFRLLLLLQLPLLCHLLLVLLPPSHLQIVLLLLLLSLLFPPQLTLLCHLLLSSSTVEPPTNTSTLSSTPFATLPVSTAALFCHPLLVLLPPHNIFFFSFLYLFLYFFLLSLGKRTLWTNFNIDKSLSNHYLVIM